MKIVPYNLLTAIFRFKYFVVSVANWELIFASVHNFQMLYLIEMVIGWSWPAVRM